MKNWNEIQGWFNYQHTFNFLLSKVPDGGIFVECGAWLGCSSSYLCDMAKDRIKVYIVDTWKGSPDELTTTQSLATKIDIFSVFLDNMGDRKFTPLKMDSREAAATFEDNSLDVVYIDMTHTYDAVRQDISYWLPKVKDGGYIAGHDYANNAPGVIQAVNEAFGDKVTIMDGNCWIVKRENL
jgi:predicted O-methyltransferase YrrM